MISTARGYRITQSKLRDLERGLAEYEKHGGFDLEPGMRQVSIDSLRAFCDQLRQELAHYDELRAGRREFALSSFEELPQALVQARIAAGLTQKQLAQKLGVKPQQIQRYEANGYKGVAWDTAACVAEALDLSFQALLRRSAP